MRGKLRYCRKCNTENPLRNIYCRSCGAALDVDTDEVKAQPKPVMPKSDRTAWLWVLLGSLVSLGLLSILLGASFFRGLLELVPTVSSNEESSLVLRADFVKFAALMGFIFITAFAVSGLVVSWLARRSLAREMIISSFLVLSLLAMVGSALTADAAVLAALFLLPSAASAILGARLGGFFSGGGGNR